MVHLCPVGSGVFGGVEMAELIMSSQLATFIERGRIDARDVMDMRQSVFANGVLCKDEAIGLFAVHANCNTKCPEWDAFFVEALSDFLVENVEPSGYINDKQAKWLMNAISRGNHIASRAEMELLITVLEKSKRSPDVLSAFALSQIADAILDHKGPLADQNRRNGVITSRDVDMLRRVLYAFGGEGSVGITKSEAEVLFRLNDKSVETENDPAWSDLFVKAIANYMMAVSSYSVPSRKEALRREDWLNKQGESRSFFTRMMADGLKGIIAAYLAPSSVETAYAAQNAKFERDEKAASAINQAEAHWLVERMNKDGYIRSNEKMLLSFFKKESQSIHPELQPLLAMVA
jgi:hypothetical protein